jgi:hypothetical protein
VTSLVAGENFVPIAADDWEGGHPWWRKPACLESGNLLSWPVLGGTYVFRYLRRRRIAAPQSQLPLSAAPFLMLSILLTVLAIDSWRVEGTVYVPFLSICGAVLSYLALVIAIVQRARSGTRAGLTLVAVLSFACSLTLAVLVVERLASLLATRQ